MSGNAGPGVTHQPGRLPAVSGRPALRRRVPARLAVAAGIVALLPAPIAAAADTTPPSVTTPVLSPNPAPSGAAVSVTATATDGTAVASAQRSLDDGASTAMSATGGAFGGTSEGLTGSVGGSVLQVAAGFVHTCAHLAHITVRCWGHNAEGELGDGTTTTWRLSPVAVTSIDALAVGPHTVCVTWASATPSLFPLRSL